MKSTLGGLKNLDTFLAQIARQQEAVAVEAKAGYELRRQAEARDADGKIERGAAGKPLDPARGQFDRIDDAVADAHHRRHFLGSLQIGVAVQHQRVRVRHLPRQAEHDAVEQDEAGLLEQAAAELGRRLDRNVQHDIGNAGERAGRLVGERHHLGAFGLGDARKADADRTSRRSRR